MRFLRRLMSTQTKPLPPDDDSRRAAASDDRTHRSASSLVDLTQPQVSRPHLLTVLTPPTLPKIHEMTGRNFHNFARLWTQHLASGSKANILSVSNDDLNIYIARHYRMSVRDLTDELVWTFVRDAADNYRAGTATLVASTTDAIMARIKYDPDVQHPVDRVRLFHGAWTKMDASHNLTSRLCAGASNQKQAVSQLIKRLRPKFFEDAVRDELTLQQRVKQRTDVEAFFVWLFDFAAMTDRVVFRARKGQEDNTKTKAKTSPKTDIADKTKTTKDKKHLDPEYRARNKPKSPCSICGEMHWKADCPKAARTRATTSSGSKGTQRSQAKGLAAKLNKPSPDTNFWPCRLESTSGAAITASVYLDDGSDINIIDTTTLGRLQDSHKDSIKIKTVPEVSLAGIDSDHVSKLTTAVDLHVHLDKDLIGRPLTLRNVTFLVYDRRLPAPILGRPIVRRSGLDVADRVASGLLRQAEAGAVEFKADDAFGDAVSETQEARDDDKAHVPLGPPATDDIEAIERCKLHDRSISNGLPEDLHDDFRDLIDEYDIWRSTMAGDPAAAVTPVEITVKPDSKPYIAPDRRYPPDQREFMFNLCKLLEDQKKIYANAKAKWAAMAYPVIKPGKTAETPIMERYRLVIDLRAVNSVTVPIAFPMPHIDVYLSALSGSSVYAQLDLHKAYWQLPCHPDSQEYHSFKTPFGVFTPTRLIQGCRDGVTAFQRAMMEILHDLVPKYVLVWLDDLLVHAPSPRELLERLHVIFRRLHSHRIMASVRKSTLFAAEVIWCGRRINAKGIGHDPDRVSGLVSRPIPSKGNELQQFLGAVQWLAESLPDHARLVAPLQSLMGSIIKDAGSSKSRKVARYRLSDMGWSEEHTRCYYAVLDRLKSSVLLAHPRSDYEFCLFTDSSDLGWGAALTQVPPEDLLLPVYDQRHEPLAFLSGVFRGSSSRWAIIDKECYPIIEALTRLEYLVLRPRGVRIFTDHRNLTYLLSPDPTVKKPTAARLQRWAARLLAFAYSIEHLDGNLNVWGDLLSRWCNPAAPRETLALAAVSAPAPDFRPGRYLSIFPDGLDFPSLAAVLRAQVAAIDSGTVPDVPTRTSSDPATPTLLVHVSEDKELWWIPDRDHLRLRFVLTAHAGAACHQGRDRTLGLLRRFVTWSSIRKDVSDFCKGCLSCVTNRHGHVIPRPVLSQAHATKPNQMLHFDYVFIEKPLPSSADGKSHVLVLKDDFSGFVELVPTSECTAHVTVNALLWWFARFGPVTHWVSDRGSHFLNFIMEELRNRLSSKHHFTTPYHPAANGTVEVVNKQLLHGLRSLLSAYKLNADQWVHLLPVVQGSINHSASSRLAGRSPAEVFTGQPRRTPLDFLFTDVFVDLAASRPDPKDIDDHLRSTRAAIEDIHRAVASSTRSRPSDPTRSSRRSRSDPKPPRPVRFSIGDFVLMARSPTRRRSKLRATFRGPMAVVDTVDHNVFKVRDLVLDSEHIVHAERLVMYADSSLDVTSEIIAQAAHDGEGYSIDRIISHSSIDGTWHLRIKWLGFENEENTDEPLDQIFADAPAKVRSYLAGVTDSAARSSMELALGIRRRS